MFERILIIDDHPAERESLELLLADNGYLPVQTASPRTALARLEAAVFDAILCDSELQGIDGFDLLPQLARSAPGVAIVLLCADPVADLAHLALERGAYDALAKPVDASRLLLTLRRAHEREDLRRRQALERRDAERTLGERPIVAASESMIELLESLERAASFKTHALLTGDAGTGKEVLARAIHAQSPRRESAFIAVDCAEASEAALERILFGQAKGHSSGSAHGQRGLISEADHGTLFLDNVHGLPAGLQEKILCTISEETVTPIGDSKSYPVDVRFIAASSREIEAGVGEDRILPDLYERVTQLELRVPALRERRADIPLLVDHFLAHYRRVLCKPVRAIDDDALDRLIHFDWPGNVRELENVVLRAMIRTETDRVGVLELPDEITTAMTDGSPLGRVDLSLKRGKRAFEAQMIRRALHATGGNRTHAAKLLEISHRALLYKLKEFDLRD